MSAGPESGWASATQQAAFEYGPWPHCLSGGFGSGKTVCGCRKVLLYCDLFPKNRILIWRRIGKELRSTTMETFYKVCPPALYTQGGRRNDQEGFCKLNNGSEILFMHLEDPGVQGVLKGLEINGFFGDQAEEAPEELEEVFDILLARLGRWDVAEVPEAVWRGEEAATGRAWPYVNPATGQKLPPPLAMLACNPDHEEHWIYKRFHEESEEWAAKYRGQGYRMFHMPSFENVHLPAHNRAFLLAQDESFQRRYVRGEWGNPEGTIHQVSKLSIVPGTRGVADLLRETCTLFRTMDHGDSAPTCVVWWAVDRNGNAVAWQEYYQPNLVISEHRRGITALSKPGERYELNLADPTIFHTLPAKKGGRFCVADEYGDVVEQPRGTALFWQPADNNELGTRNRINEYLKVDPQRVHPFLRTKGAPRLFFVTQTADWPTGVAQALRQVRAQRRVKVGTVQGKPVFSDERDEAVVDHAYDCVRYFIASRPPMPTEKALKDVGTFRAARRQARRQRRVVTVR